MLALLLCLVCTCLSMQGQDGANARMLNYNTGNGLSNNMITGMVADSTGWLWVSHGNAIGCFDGMDFYYPNMGLVPYTQVAQIFKTDKGDIWTQSLSGDLASFMPSTNRFELFEFNEKIRPVTKEKSLESLKVTKDGSVWMAVRGRGIYIISKEGDLRNISDSLRLHGYAVVDFAEGTPVLASMVDSSRLGEPFSVYVLNEDFSIRSQARLSETELGHAPQMLDLPNGHKLLSTGTRTLVEFDASWNGQSFRYRHAVNGLLLDNRNGLWIGGDVNGVAHHFNADYRATPESIYLKGKPEAKPGISDADGGVWMATRDEGVFQVPYPYYRFYRMNDDLLDISNSIISITNDRERIWFVNRKSGIGYFQPGDTALRLIKLDTAGLELNGIKSIHFDTLRNILWLGTGNGLFACDPQDGRPFQPADLDSEAASGIVKEILPGNDPGEMLVIFEQPHFFLRMNGGEVRFKSMFFEDYIHDVVSLKDGRAWASTWRGIWKYAEGNWENFHDSFPYLSKHPARLVYTDSSLWVSTMGWATVSVIHGQLDTIAYRGWELRNTRNLFRAENGDLIGTNMDGMVCIAHPDDSEKRMVSVFPGDIEVLKSQRWLGNRLGDEYYAGTPSGICRISMPDQIMPQFQAPRTIISSLKINGKDTTIQSSYDLDYDQNFIDLDLRQLQFLQSTYTIKYLRYALKGLEQDWNEVKEKSSITYTTLPSGEYQLKFYSYFGNGYRPDPTVIDISIHPPYWETWWFRLLVGLVLAASILALFLFRSRQIVARERLKSEMALESSRLEMRALKAQINPHFIFNAISSVQYYLKKNRPEEAGSYLQRFAGVIRQVLENSEEALVPLTSELKLMKHYVELESERFDGDPIQFKVSLHEVDEHLTLVPPTLFQPYIENAVWHGLRTKAGERILHLQFTVSSDLLLISITDNGVGRKAAAQHEARGKHRSFGMMIASRRIEILNQKHNGSIEVEDLEANGVASGTCVRLSIPHQTIPQ